ncbi:MAG: endonuclease/exonuclease/phosphatase family protein [Verrucomicrobiae bacterium]|nr:endonuclease/exonuclease/phosphatase family protein [Verrucomicrobiae bacterium]
MAPLYRKTASFLTAVFLCLSSFPAHLNAQDSKEPAPGDSPVPPAPPGAITIAAYNLMNYLAMERRVNGETVPDASKPEAEIKAVIEGLVAIRPDILGVCELGDSRFLSDLQTRLRAEGIDLPHTELVKDSAGWNRNIALLSRFPIIARHSRDDYTYELDGTRHAVQRGVLDVKIAVSPTYHLRYIGLHLKSKREVPEGDQALMRLNEARLARLHLDRILEAEPGANLIVAGDFNDLRGEAPVKTIQGGFGGKGYLTALGLEDPYGFRWTHHWSFADAYSRFDYVLYSEGLKDELVRNASGIHHWKNWDKASDHRPLFVRILPEDR